MKREFLGICLGCLLAVPLLAGEALFIDGVKYEGIRWGPVSQGKVVIFHNRGAATIPLAKLPSDIQERFGYHPPDPPPGEHRPVEPAAETVVAEEVIAETATNTTPATAPALSGRPVWLMGFVRSQGELTENDQTSHGLIIELAEKKPDAAHVPANMQMRPGLWKATGQMIFLKDSPLTNEVGMLVRVYAIETGHIKDYRTFVPAKPPAAGPQQPTRTR